MTTRCPVTDPAITVEGLRKRYGKVVALDGLSFDVPAGTVVGLLGPNGSGKTTTVAILSTALRQDGGTAMVCGLDIADHAAEVRGLIGFAGQFAAVDANLTGAENLTLIARLSRVPRRDSKRRADELLHRFGLADAAGRLARTYSGGMRRRLDLAAALAHRPPVLFLDEPTAGLDPESRRGLWDMVRELVADGTTVLLTTQYLEEADVLADHVVIIDKGRAVETGTPADLKHRVGSAIVQLAFPAAGDAVDAARRLAGQHFEPRQTGSSLEVRTADGSAVVVDVIRALDGSGLRPTAVEIREPTLDDVFLTLTGNGTSPSQDTSERGAP
jgi:ABC-2 type transport system ATP-binding protein